MGAPGKDAGPPGGFPHSPLEPRAFPNNSRTLPSSRVERTLGKNPTLSFPPSWSDSWQTGTLWKGAQAATPLSRRVLFGLSLSICNTRTRRFLGSWLSQREMQTSSCSQDGWYCYSFVGEEGRQGLLPQDPWFSLQVQGRNSHS